MEEENKPIPFTSNEPPHDADIATITETEKTATDMEVNHQLTIDVLKKYNRIK